MSAPGLYRLLERSASRVPDAPAVVMEEVVWSYRELLSRAERCSDQLASLGVKAGDRVGMMLQKCPDSIAAIFGILGCNAAYVPVDPDAPTARALTILEDCGVSAVVCDDGCLGSIDQELDGRCGVLVSRDEEWAQLDRRAGWSNSTFSHVDSLAYILYTSGSTGVPKGVMITDAASLAFVDWAVSELRLTDADRMANHAPLHFDLSILDVFGAVHAGAAIVLVPKALSVFPRDLAGYIESQGITVWYSVPAVLRLLSQFGGLADRDLSSLRLVLFAGEVFAPKHLQVLQTQLPAATYYNLYGPTETNVCTFHRVDRLAEGDEAPIPIGIACDSVRAVAVGDDGAVAGVGGQGELLVSGGSVMAGYWGRPELTADVFVDGVEGLGGPGYRTGDLVLQDGSGCFSFVGRLDSQIKTRGYRVELGDVQAALEAHPAVQEAAVWSVPDAQTGQLIMGGYVGSEKDGIPVDQIVSFLADRLPAYMLPSRLTEFDKFPRTSTGKIDMQSLRSGASA